MESANGRINNVVLVHGAWVDGSGWKPVHELLTTAGYTVSIVQNPTITLADDVAFTRRAVGAHNGPVLLVGHSYGGAVISEAGNDQRVVGLVYIAGWVPDRGESVGLLVKKWSGDGSAPPILPPQERFFLLDRSKFRSSFADDVGAETAAFMADAQVPWGEGALTGTVNEPAWKSKPCWYVVSTNDRMIPADAQRAMARQAGATVVEVKGSHAVFLSQPQAVAALIEQAASRLAPR